MTEISKNIPPEVFLLQMFSSRAARQGRVIRRSKRDIENFVGLETFLTDIQRRGYQAIENAGQIIIFCNAEPIRPLTRRRKSLQRIFHGPFTRDRNPVPYKGTA